MRSIRLFSIRLSTGLLLAGAAGLATGCTAVSNFGTSAASSGCAAANASCTSISGAAGPVPIPSSGVPSGIPLYIGDSSTAGQWTYSNEPLVTVTVCSPNHTLASQCTSISNILLDTGSYGLRVFSSVIPSNVVLTQQTISVAGIGTLDVGECAEFGSGADWGPVQKADVVWGGQIASNIPIQVIDYGFASIPSGCAALCPDTDPCTAQFNGILGVGVFAQDCGSGALPDSGLNDYCDSTNDEINPGFYFGCDASGCYDAYASNCAGNAGDGICMFQVGLTQQVINPVASFASPHNNGVSLTLPTVAPSGTSSLTSGTLTIGIGSPSSASLAVYPADSGGMLDGNGADFLTEFQGTTYGEGEAISQSFLDSGSNALYFPSDLATCADAPDFYCEAQTLPATIEGFNNSSPDSSGTPADPLNFSVGDSDALFATDNSAFGNLAGPASGMFDWGLPFFYGRTVYVGINGTSANITGVSASGPYWAF